MSKGTLLFLFILSIIATLLLGINIGKKISSSDLASSPVSPTAAAGLSPTLNPAITIRPTLILDELSDNTTQNKTGATSTYTDESCGFSFSIPTSYIKSTSENGKSTIITNPDNTKDIIAAACDSTLPRPPLSADKIEAYTLAGIAAILYHDQTPEGNPRDEVIVKHPNRNLEIIIAGYGTTFQQVLANFRFIR